MPIKRTYADHGDACATAHALELIGDRWNYPILRELMLAPKRFGELLPAVRGITPTVLTSRLRSMVTAGLVRKVRLPAPANVAAYETTEWTRELEPVLRQLGRWALASPTRTVDGCGLTPDATIQSMRTMAPQNSVSAPIEVVLHLVDGRISADAGYDYRITWDEGGLTADRGENPGAPVRVRADSTTWARILYDGLALDAEGVQIDGSRATVERLVAQFGGGIPAS